jgi:hypothetical protein
VPCPHVDNRGIIHSGIAHARILPSRRDEAFQAGYAEENKYKLVPAGLKEKEKDELPQMTRKFSQSLTKSAANLYKKINR